MAANKTDYNLLINSLKNGGLSAFETIYNTYYSPLCQYGLKFTTDTNIIEDVVQDTFVYVWSNRNKININTSLKSYLYRVFYNKLMDTFNNYSKNQKVHLQYYQDSIAAIIDSVEEDEMNKKYFEEKLNECISKLPVRCKSIFLESKINGLKYSEIAQKFDISIKTIEGHIRRGYVFLRECFNNDYQTIIN